LAAVPRCQCCIKHYAPINGYLCTLPLHFQNKILLTNVRLYTFVYMSVPRKSTRKAQIELQATQLFRTKGYAASSMRDLAQALQMEAASLYSHISSKEDLLQGIVFRMAAAFFEALDAAEQASKDPVEQLQRAIEAHLMVITKDPSASAVFFHEWRHLGPKNLEKFLELRRNYEERFEGYIKQGIASGVFEAPDTRLAALTLLASLNWVHQWYKPEGKMGPKEIAQNLAQLTISGLKSRT